VCRSCCRLLADDHELRENFNKKVSNYIRRTDT
jgi:hypothetical protein